MMVWTVRTRVWTLKLQTMVHAKVRNHGEGLLWVESAFTLRFYEV